MAPATAVETIPAHASQASTHYPLTFPLLTMPQGDDRPSSQPSLDAAINKLPTSLIAAPRPPPAIPRPASVTPTSGPSAPAPPPAGAAPPLSASQQDALDSVFAFHGAAEFTPVSLVAQTPALATTSKALTPMSTGEITMRVDALPASQPMDDPLRFTNLISQLALPDPVSMALAPRAPSPAASAHSFAHSASSPAIDLSDANWHTRPDRPLTANDYSLAISAIKSGTALSMTDFLAGPPAIDAPSTPSQWDVTPRPASFLQKLDTLAASFPRSAEDMLVTALSLNGESLTDVSTWLEKESSRKADILALRDAFPDADTDILLEALSKHGKSFTSSYWFLAGKFASSWGHASVAPRGTVGIMDLDSDSDNEFVSATQSHYPVEDKWWDTFAQTRSFKIKDLPAASQWSPVCRVAMARQPLTPRVLGLIRDLGLLLKAPRDFQRGVGSLSSFPSYRRVSDYAASHSLESHNIVACLTLLLSEGLLAAGASAWLAEKLMQDPPSYSSVSPMFSSFSGKYGAIRSARNSHLRKWRRDEALAASADRASSVSGSGGVQRPSSTAGLSRTESRYNAPAPYQGVVRVNRPGEPLALAAPRSTKASSALAQEAEHQDMQSLLQSTLDNFSLVHPAPADPPPAAGPKPHIKSAAASASARVLRNAKKKAASDASSAIAAAKEADMVYRKAQKKAAATVSAAKTVGKPRGKKSAAPGSVSKPIVIDDSPQA